MKKPARKARKSLTSLDLHEEMILHLEKIASLLRQTNLLLQKNVEQGMSQQEQEQKPIQKKSTNWFTKFFPSF